MARKYVLSTDRGLEINVLPASSTLIEAALKSLEAEYRKRGEPVDPPTYSVTLASGDVETYTHDEKSVQGDEAALSQWKKYQAASARLQAEQYELRMKLLLSGIDVEILDNGWEARHRRMRVEVPDKEKDPEGYWWHYLTTEVLVTPDDLLRAIEICTKATYHGGVDDAKIEAAMDSFRRVLREGSTESIENRVRPVVAQPAHGAGAGSEGMGENPI